MIGVLRHVLAFRHFPFPEDLILESLALRQQLLALHSKHPRRRLATTHKHFCEGFGQDGRNRSCWSHQDLPWLGIGPGFGRTGDGCHELGSSTAGENAVQETEPMQPVDT
jgi:hypothetical protein